MSGFQKKIKTTHIKKLNDVNVVANVSQPAENLKKRLVYISKIVSKICC